MRQSLLFTKSLHEAPADAASINAQFLERAGFVYKNSSGVYSYLPLGWRVIQRIINIIREEMEVIGGQELLLPALVEKRYLDVTGRWDVEVGYRVKGFGEKEEKFVLGWTHEEVLTEIASHYINSENDLPFAAYQIQTKFRNEPRAKSGVLRGKEFIMKDLYSFHATQEDFEKYYLTVKGAYETIFARCGLSVVYTVAGGGAFTGNTTHEFQVISSIGEDTIFVCSECHYAENSEITKLNDGERCPHCGGTVAQKKGIEVGNIFPLGVKYSEAFKMRTPVIMGSYGIGVSRLLGTIVEIHHDDKGIVWPSSVAPFQVHLLELGDASARDVYEGLQKRGVTVLYDDRKTGAGDKLVTSDLLGIPYRAVVSEKTMGKIEVRRRDQKEIRMVSFQELCDLI